MSADYVGACAASNPTHQVHLTWFWVWAWMKNTVRLQPREVELWVRAHTNRYTYLPTVLMMAWTRRTMQCSPGKLSRGYAAMLLQQLSKSRQMLCAADVYSTQSRQM